MAKYSFLVEVTLKHLAFRAIIGIHRSDLLLLHNEIYHIYHDNKPLYQFNIVGKVGTALFKKNPLFGCLSSIR